MLNAAFVTSFDSNFERHPTRSVLYVPTNRLCLFYAILVPSQDRSYEPISFIECSITDPRDTTVRLPKALNIATLIQSTLQKEAGVRIVVFFSGSLSELKNSRQSTTDKYSASLQASVIVCKEGCQQLGVIYQ